MDPTQVSRRAPVFVMHSVYNSTSETKRPTRRSLTTSPCLSRKDSITFSHTLLRAENRIPNINSTSFYLKCEAKGLKTTQQTVKGIYLQLFLPVLPKI